VTDRDDEDNIGNDEDDPNSLEANVVRLALEGKLSAAGDRAVAEQKALGLPVTFQRGNQVIKQHPDGREEVLATIPQTPPYRPPPGVSVARLAQGGGVDEVDAAPDEFAQRVTVAIMGEAMEEQEVGTAGGHRNGPSRGDGL
jgi:hypothetical protein